MTARKRPTKEYSGSPSTGEPEYLLVGILRRPHGVKGEMLMEVVTDFPERLEPGVSLFLGPRRVQKIIAARREHARGLLLRLQGVDSPEAAGTYRNQSVCVLSADRPTLPAGQFYHHELLGSTIVDEQLGPIGELVEILQTGANDVYVVKRAAGRDMLLPVIPGVVLDIDAYRRVITVHVPEGIDAGPGK